jgi:hypothetical protein
MLDENGSRGDTNYREVGLTDTRRAPSLDAKALDIELQKLTLERTKVRWTAISVMIPLLAAIGTVAFGIWSTRQQEQSSFQLEVAKSVMTASSPSEAIFRRDMLSRTFADRLPPKFLPKIDLTGIADKGPENADAKAHFVELVASRGMSPLETAKLWHSVFKEPWSDDPDAMVIIEKASENPPVSPDQPRPAK